MATLIVIVSKIAKILKHGENVRVIIYGKHEKRYNSNRKREFVTQKF